MNYLNPNLSATTGVEFLYEVGLRIVFIRSRVHLYGEGHSEWDTRLYEPGHPAVRSRAFRVENPAIRNTANR